MIHNQELQKLVNNYNDQRNKCATLQQKINDLGIKHSNTEKEDHNLIDKRVQIAAQEQDLALKCVSGEISKEEFKKARRKIIEEYNLIDDEKLLFKTTQELFDQYVKDLQDITHHLNHAKNSIFNYLHEVMCAEIQEIVGNKIKTAWIALRCSYAPGIATFRTTYPDFLKSLFPEPLGEDEKTISAQLEKEIFCE